VSEEFSLSLVAVDVLWEELGLAAVPVPLQVPSHGETYEERGRLKREVWQDLAGRGLARRGRLESELEDALRVLAGFTSAISLFGVLDDERPVRARVSGNARYAVLASQDEDGIRLAQAESTKLAWSIVDVLPAVRAFPGRPVTIRECGPEDSGYRAPGTQPTPDEAEAQRMLSTPRLRAGYFTAYGRDARGRVTASPELAWTDTAQGRFSSRMRTTRGGRTFTDHAPATSADLARHLRDLLTYVHADD
jgi:hypothetical protein